MPRKYLTVPVELELAELVAQEARRKLFGAFAPALN